MALSGFFDKLNKSFEEKFPDQAKQFYEREAAQKRIKERELEAQRKAAEEAAKKAEEEARCAALRQQLAQVKQKKVEHILSFERGSQEYLRARYGDYAYDSMLAVCARELEVTEQDAARFLTENYSEELWRLWGDPIVEELMNNR